MLIGCMLHLLVKHHLQRKLSGIKEHKVGMFFFPINDVHLKYDMDIYSWHSLKERNNVHLKNGLGK